MLRLFNLTIPAAGAGVDPVPVSVSGCTQFFCLQDFEAALDPADFNSGQYATFLTGLTGKAGEFVYPDNTILWVRQNPTGGAPATTLNVQTGLQKGVY
jgi:hypothetical protein